jgi:dTDP-4-dehydrorhamnose 3,5-epimerase-like enzyme
MSLKVTPTALPEVLLIEPKVFGDARGFLWKALMPKFLLKQRVSKQPSFKIITQGQPEEF